MSRALQVDRCVPHPRRLIRCATQPRRLSNCGGCFGIAAYSAVISGLERAPGCCCGGVELMEAPDLNQAYVLPFCPELGSFCFYILPIEVFQFQWWENPDCSGFNYNIDVGYGLGLRAFKVGDLFNFDVILGQIRTDWGDHDCSYSVPELDFVCHASPFCARVRNATLPVTLPNEHTKHCCNGGPGTFFSKGQMTIDVA